MPGPYIHISAMRHARRRLGRGFKPLKSERVPRPDAAGVDPEELSRLLREHPNFAALGAIGPDLFFFLPDFRDVQIGNSRINLSSVLVGLLDFLNDVYATLDPFITKYERFLGPLEENLEEEISRLTGGLSEAVSNVLGQLKDILIGVVEGLATQQIDFFSFFSLGFNKGYDEQAFLWSDMLHYKKTGAFGQALWDVSQERNDDRLKAYALGYLTHIATDVTGHAMVNQIAGGPFRLHWQRHHLVENHLDSLWCLNDPLRVAGANQYDQLTESALYFDVAFGRADDAVDRPPYPTGQTLRERYVRRRTLDIDSDLPKSVAELLIQAMESVYYVDGQLHPQILRDNDGKPNVELITQTYDLLFRFLKLTTTDGFGHERPEPPEVFPNLDFPVWNDPGADSAPGDDDGDSSFWEDLLDFLLSIVKVIIYIVQVAAWLASLPWAVLADVVTYPIRLGIYYALELPLWHLFKSVRSALVMTGYLAPMDDEITMSLTRVGFPDSAAFEEIKQHMEDVFGGLEDEAREEDKTTWRDPAYPHLNSSDDYLAPWLYPRTAPELPSVDPRVIRATKAVPPQSRHLVTASPHAKHADVTTLFAAVVSDPRLRDDFEGARTPGEADAAGLRVNPDSHLGDAVSFSEYLCWLATRQRDGNDGPKPLVDWNMDADRGYGHHCWDWNRRAEGTGIDPEGLQFPLPCRPPSQADGFAEDQAVLGHFDSEQDPGCDLDTALNVMLEGKPEP